MIIFGTRGVTSTRATGQFFCPGCSGQASYRHRAARRFFTLYFIPLIPLGSLGEYVECDRCKGTYQMKVLDLDPNAGRAEFAAEFHRAIKQVMVDMLLADGKVDDAEVEMIRNVYSRLTRTEVSEEAIRAEIRTSQTSRRDAVTALAPLAGTLNDAGKEMVVKAAFMVAVADGSFDDQEKKLIASIAHTLGMTTAHLAGVLGSLARPQ